MNEVFISRQIVLDELPSDQEIEQWILAVLAQQDRQGEVAVEIVASDTIEELNRDYRGKDKATNVLSFPSEPPPGLPEEMFNELGDLIICPQVVASEADEQGKPLAHHWAHMVVHGTLHLLGYDHIEPEEAEVMERLERQILANFAIPDPYLIEKL